MRVKITYTMIVVVPTDRDDEGAVAEPRDLDIDAMAKAIAEDVVEIGGEFWPQDVPGLVTADGDDLPVEVESFTVANATIEPEPTTDADLTGAPVPAGTS